MKIKITNTGNLRQAILQSGLIEHIERVIEMDEVGFIFGRRFNDRQSAG